MGRSAITAGQSIVTTSTSPSDSSINLVSRRILNQQILRKYTTLRVVRDVARIPLGRRIADLAGRKRAALQRILGVAADSRDLLGESEDDGLVCDGGAGGGRVLVLLDGGDFRVGGWDRGAGLGF